MAHPLYHAKSSANKFGGHFTDYIRIHQWFDASKEATADVRHRMLRHHTFGIFEAERVFGIFIINSDGKEVAVRAIGEQHVQEDLGFIPTVNQWIEHLQRQPWMSKSMKLSKILE